MEKKRKQKSKRKNKKKENKKERKNKKSGRDFEIGSFVVADWCRGQRWGNRKLSFSFFIVAFSP